ncbi:unnamed protein product [Didymodactylos carnosus]|uniref:Uncharacterized protein n=1 Tax=Didymodactylos carnosus TaxID=1234261 RepID=A0A8S2HVH5_9BILA|nr:unnamed protein product [Didymodactylos carnosus]CAF3671120.1 unnamed protein product [Didymodactylos carnosus]
MSVAQVSVAQMSVAQTSGSLKCRGRSNVGVTQVSVAQMSALKRRGRSNVGVAQVSVAQTSVGVFYTKLFHEKFNPHWPKLRFLIRENFMQRLDELQAFSANTTQAFSPTSRCCGFTSK